MLKSDVFAIFKKFCMFIQFLKVTLHLQLLQNIGYIPCVVQCILVTYFIPNILYLLIPYPSIAPPRFPLPTGTHYFVLYICESGEDLFLTFSYRAWQIMGCRSNQAHRMFL